MMKVKPVKLGKTERMSFSRIDEVIEMPNLGERKARFLEGNKKALIAGMEAAR